METKDTLSSCSNSKAQQKQQIQDKAKKSCMVSFQQLHSHLKQLSQNDLQGTRTESGFKRAFAILSCQDIETFTGTMFLHVKQLEKQLDKDEFQKIGSMDAFNVLETQFHITQQAILEFCDTLIQHLEYVKKSIDERAHHKREYDSWVNERQMQTTEEKVDTSKALDASLVDTESSVIESKEQDTSSRSGNDAHDDGADIRPIYDEEPMAKEAKKKAQERNRNSEPSLMPSARSQSTTNGSKPKPRINNQTSRNWHVSKSSCVMTKHVPIAEHYRNSRNFSDSKHFVCSTCQQCVFSANHDSCLTKLLNEVNSHAKVPSNKSPKRNKPVEQISVPNEQERHIPIGHRFSIQKTSVVQKKIMTHRSCLRWKPTGKIFKTVGLRWVPTRKIFTSSTTKVDSEPLNGSNADITNQYECEQTLDVSAGTLNLSAGTSFNPKEEGLRV
nr:hypothetical protein [Tanacetum cinerariifolium]